MKPPDSVMKSVLIRPCRPSERTVFYELANKEGWNPGCESLCLDRFFPYEQLLVAELHGQIVGIIGCFTFGKFAWVGFFICEKAYRQQGIGKALWNEGVVSGLQSYHIGLDAVSSVVPVYERFGFSSAWTLMRYKTNLSRIVNLQIPSLLPEHNADHLNSSSISVLALNPSDHSILLKCIDYDQIVYPELSRRQFMESWLEFDQSRVTVCIEKSQDNQIIIRGFGLIRSSEIGYRIGPLLADNLIFAIMITKGLIDRCVEESQASPSSLIFFDIPDTNSDAMRFANILEAQVHVKCERMYKGQEPKRIKEKEFATTNLELTF